MTDTVRIKTEELADEALRYAVAVAAHSITEKEDRFVVKGGGLVLGEIGRSRHEGKQRIHFVPTRHWWPDRDWSQLGPLIERYGLDILTAGKDGWLVWWWPSQTAKYRRGPVLGETLPMSACRAIASAHFGDYADVPRELVEDR